jgi:predicted membrane protein
MNDDYGRDMGNRIRDEINARIHTRVARRRAEGNSNALISGLVIVAVGMVLLLAQLGIFNWAIVWNLWPLIFIVVGLGKVFGSARAGKVSGIFIFVLGALLLLHAFGRFPYAFWQLWPLMIIAGGAELFWNAWSNPTVTSEDGTRVSNNSEINTTNIFGGSESTIVSKDFRRGEVVAIFGGFQIDLTRAEIAGTSARIDATAVFGGGEIRVPPTWNVVVKGVGIFGGYSDETQQILPDPGKPTKTLIVEGAAVFGGVTVKN